MRNNRIIQKKTNPRSLYEVRLVKRSAIKSFIEKNHYSHNINGLKVSYCFGVFNRDGNLVGGVIFGQLSTTAWKKYGKTEEEVLELRRLVLADSCVFNSESYVVGACIRHIRKHALKVKVIVSYADPYYGHSGIIYKASNFKYEGTTAKDTVLVDKTNGKRYHSRAMRTKYKGKFKPFALRLQEKFKEGKLEIITVPPKHIYTYRIQ